MKISGITLYHVSMALRSPFETSFGRSETRDCILIEARSGEITAYGECVADKDPGYSYETVGTAWHILCNYLVPAVLGVDLEGPDDLQRRLARVRGHHMAKAGLEMALWDLQGKLTGRSLRQMLGGSRLSVDVGVSVGLQASPAALVKTVESYLQQGYRRIKIKIKPGAMSPTPRLCARLSPVSACRWMPTRLIPWIPPLH